MAVPVGKLNAGEIDETHYESASALAKKRMRGQIAPLKAIDLLRVAGTETLEAGMKRERKVFLDLRQSDQARALRHIFFAERGGKKIPSDLKSEMKTPGSCGRHWWRHNGRGYCLCFFKCLVQKLWF